LSTQYPLHRNQYRDTNQDAYDWGIILIHQTLFCIFVQTEW